MRFGGRVALVSGSLRGIERAHAERLSSEGATVVLTDLDAPGGDGVAEPLAAVPQAIYLRLDAASEKTWLAAWSHIESAFGRLDVLVNNAGTSMSVPCSAWSG